MSPLTLAIGVGCIAVALLVHEFAHAWMAFQLGDPTAKYEGRLTLNPMVHFEPMGAICLVLSFWVSGGSLIMGWAKPVPIDDQNFKSPNLDTALVAAAGPFVNFFFAFLCSMIYLTGLVSGTFLQLIVVLLITANVGFGIFNLIPFPPLDGWKITGSVMPEAVRDKMQSWERRAGLYGLVGLFVLLAFIGPAVLTPLNAAALSIFLGSG